MVQLKGSETQLNCYPIITSKRLKKIKNRFYNTEVYVRHNQITVKLFQIMSND